MSRAEEEFQDESTSAEPRLDSDVPARIHFPPSGLVEFECPQCSGHVYKKHSLHSGGAWMRLGYWHMILNPGLAFNELILGQRTPKELYACMSCEMGEMHRSYVYCPGCFSFQPAAFWSGRAAFGNWLGIVCPQCGTSIPCLWNLTSLFILAVTLPLWWYPVGLTRTRLLRARQTQMEKRLFTVAPEKKPFNALLAGALWGLLMDLFFSAYLLAIGSYYYPGMSLLTLSGIYLGIAAKSLPIWALGGLFFGLTMKFLMDKKGDKRLRLTFTRDGMLVDSLSQDSEVLDDPK